MTTRLTPSSPVEVKLREAIFAGEKCDLSDTPGEIRAAFLQQFLDPSHGHLEGLVSITGAQITGHLDLSGTRALEVRLQRCQLETVSASSSSFHSEIDFREC